MKQGTTIVIGFIIIIILVTIWVYLLFFGTPKDPDEVFSNFNLGGEETGGTTTSPIVEPEPPVVNMERPRLRQLTTRPVIGFIETQVATSAPIYIRYVETGTGHIYNINLTSGEEERISNTTVAEASLATFSPDGTTVAIRPRNDRRANELTVGTIENGELKSAVIKEQVYDFALTSSSTLLFTTRDSSGLIGQNYNLATKKQTPLFAIPFFDATISWGTSSSDTHVVYPKTTHLLEGYLYTFTNGTMERLPAAGYGLSAQNSPKYITYTRTSNYVPATTIYNKATGSREESQIILLPEKCGVDIKDSRFLWCGYEAVERAFEFPDNWYRGEISFSDSLWRIDLGLNSAEFIVDPKELTGREIDVVMMTTGKSGTALYFINKNDNTLWMYEL